MYDKHQAGQRGMKASVALLHIARLAAAFLALVSFSAFAAAATASQSPVQDLGILKNRIEDFLKTQSAGYPGKVTVSTGSIDPNLKLAQCPAPEVFLPQGSRAWGKTSVGIRCQAPVLWTIYVQAKVSVRAQYLVAAIPLTQGHVVSAQDVAIEEGDITQLPGGIFTDGTQVHGRHVVISMTAGSILRQDMLKQPPVVQQGQTVLLTSSGKGFSVSTEAKALNNAVDGQVVQVKVESGQVVSGIARNGGKVEVSF